jgi:hypothetical protein
VHSEGLKHICFCEDWVNTLLCSHCTDRHPLRGEIDVGLAVEMGPEEIYGWALASSHTPESKAAKYPRIVIGNELWRYFNAAITQFERQTTPVAQSITAIVKKTMELVAVDEDGKRILDYLGQTMVDNAAAGRKPPRPSR